MDSRVKVLVTTRERTLNVNFEAVPLDVLSLEDAIKLFGKIIGIAKVEQEKQTVEAICDSVGYLPLAIELLGEYLAKKRHLSFAKLQEQLSLADESLSRERKGKFYGYRGVEAAIKLSWDDLNNASQRVAMLLGLFAPVKTQWKLVEDIAENAGISEEELEAARGQLDSSHLMQPIDEECNFYQVHTLVRAFFRQQLTQDIETNHAFRRAFVESLLMVAKQIPPTPTRNLIEAVTPAIPHLELLNQEMLDDIPNPDQDLIRAFFGVASFYYGQGQYALAETPLQNCLNAVESRLGAEHPHVATSLNNLALLYKSQGK